MPDLRVVSERSKEEIKKQEATRALKQALRELSANLMRIVRGAGKPDLLGAHLNECAVTFNSYRDIFGRVADGTVLSELLRLPGHNQDLESDRLDEELLEHAICRSALQIIASTLVEQRIQREKALGDLQRQLRSFEDIRKRRLRRHRTALRQVTRRPKSPPGNEPGY